MLRQIRYFQAVVRCKSFSEAAEECYISQSAISQQIQALEKELGVKLLHRENRRFSLTPAGEHFYKKSLLLTADYDRLCQETVQIANQDQAKLRIGYLKGYSGQEFRLAVAAFSQKYPNVEIQIINGNHEDLYNELREDRVDLILSDQRRAFSDEYENVILTTRDCHIEIAARNPIAGLNTVELKDLKNLPCILIASKEQRENEQTYYREIVGIHGDILFADNLEDARMMVLGNRGFIPIEGGDTEMLPSPMLCRILLTRNGKAIKRNYCAFWKVDNSGYYIEDFADILKSQFQN